MQLGLRCLGPLGGVAASSAGGANAVVLLGIGAGVSGVGILLDVTFLDGGAISFASEWGTISAVPSGEGTLGVGISGVGAFFDMVSSGGVSTLLASAWGVTTVQSG